MLRNIAYHLVGKIKSDSYALKYDVKHRNHREKYEYSLQNKFNTACYEYNIKTSETWDNILATYTSFP